jgi:hypothetical protein
MTVHSWFLTSSSGGKSEWVRDNGCEYLAGLYRMWRHDSNIEVGHRSPVVCTAVGAKAIMALPPDIVAPGRNTDCGFVGDLGSGKRLQAPNERNHDVVVTNGSRSARPDYSAHRARSSVACRMPCTPVPHPVEGIECAAGGDVGWDLLRVDWFSVN